MLRPRLEYLNEVVREAAATYGTTVVDFAAEPLSGHPALWHDDRLHANTEGHRRIAAALVEAYGLPDADTLGFMYGGTHGFDWHVLSRHHSLGILAGARLYPNLVGLDDEQAIGIHSAVYLKYVF